MLSEAKFTELLEELVGHDQVEIPDILLPVVWRFWESDDTVSAMQALQAGNDARLLPAALSDAVRYHLHDDAKYLVQTNPGYALAALLTMIWVGQVRNPRLQQVAEAISRREHWERVAEVISRREIRVWAECLIPVARYLEPALDGSTSKRGHPNILNYIGDVTWVEQWIGPGELAHEVADLAKDIPIGTYQRWRAAGVKQLWSGVKTILSGPPLTAAEIAATLPTVSTTAALRPTRTPVVLETPPLSDSDLNLQPFLPPLPRLRIERQQQPDIIAALLDGQHRAFILYGGAGMGKTTLAGQVLRAPEVQAAFPGGIAWAPGDSSVEEIAAAWCAALNLKRNPNTTWTQCWRQGGANMEKTLLVLDDVVNLSDAAVLVDGFSPDAVVLLTTQFGAKTWEALAHSWLEPEAIWRGQIGAFTPTEARTLVEQAQGRLLTAEEMVVLEQLGARTGWNPLFWSRVALQTGLDAWQTLLLETQASGFALGQIAANAQAQWVRMQSTVEQDWLMQLGTHLLTPTPFGNGYAAAVWQIQPQLVDHRLHRLEALGLVEGLEFGDPARIVTQLWRIRPEILACFWKPPRFKHRGHNVTFRRQRARLAQSILADTPTGWAIPWQFRLASLPWFVITLPWELLGIILLGLFPQLKQRESWTRHWLSSVEQQRQEHLQRRGIQLPIEHPIIADAANYVFWYVLIGELLALIAVGAIAWLLLSPWLDSAVKDWVFTWLWTRQGWTVIMGGLGLWAALELSRMPWLLYRMGVDYPPLHCLARAARWLGMREPERMESGAE